MKNPIVVRIAAIVIVLLACEALARLGLTIFDSRLAMDWRFQEVDFVELLASKEERVHTIVSDEDSDYIDIDPDLGWTVRPHGTTYEGESGGRAQLYRANSRGIRSSSEYPETPDGSTVRIAAFGDSFTHADDVPNDAAWTTILERENQDIEVLNFGVPGYGTDQALLRYRRDGKQFFPDIAILGVMSENLNRNVNVFIPFYRHESWPTTKPRFLITNQGELVLRTNAYPHRSDYWELLNDPVGALENLGANDWWYTAKFKPGILDLSALFRTLHYGYILFRYTWLLDGQDLYNRRSEHYRLLLKIIEAFTAEALQNQSVPVILLFPSLEVLIQSRHTGNFMYSPLAEDLDSRSIRYIDLLQGIRKYGSELYSTEVIPNHFSVEGNEIIAKYVAEELEPVIEDLR